LHIPKIQFIFPISFTTKYKVGVAVRYMSSTVCLSVCNARPPYSGGWHVRQYF